MVCFSRIAIAIVAGTTGLTALQLALMYRKWRRHMALDDSLYCWNRAPCSSASVSTTSNPDLDSSRRQSNAGSEQETESIEERPSVDQSVRPLFLEMGLRRQFNHRRGQEEWMPVMHHDAQCRGLLTRGLRFASYLKLWAVIGRQYFMSMIRNVSTYVIRGARPQTREALYLAVINTALCAFMNDEGHLEFHDVIMPRCHKFGPLRPRETATQLLHFDRMYIELDHAQQTLVRIDADAEVVEDPNEMCSILTLVLAGRCHTHLHWWCNGIGDATDVWPLAEKSMEMTQYLNYLAVFGACDFLGISSANLATLLQGNLLREGFPVHSESTRRVAHTSRTHRMASATRKALAAQLGYDKMAIVEAIVAATVLHSADHYYFDLFTEMHGPSNLLQGGNNLTMRLTVVGPIHVVGGLLVRQNLNDPICATIYACCKAVDATFADKGLFIGPTS